MNALKFVFRQLLKSPRVSVFTPALGIGASMNSGASKKRDPINSPKEIIE
jgi:hypothetical protein